MELKNVQKVKSKLPKFISTIFFGSRTAQVGIAIILGMLIFILVGPFFVPYSPTAVSSDLNSPPSYAHPFGTDFQGHDILSQTIFGAYPSMLIALLASIGGAISGLFVGVIGGYFSKAEAALSGAVDVILTFPPLPLLILIGLLYPNLGTVVVLALIFILWAPVARAIRAQVMSIKERPYVDAAKSSGMGSLSIVTKIVIPDVASIAFAYFVLDVAVAVVLITALEFLGIGNPNDVSWGSMFFWADQFAFPAGDWWWILAPGVSITLVAVGFALIGFSIEEVMNPRLRT